MKQILSEDLFPQFFELFPMKDAQKDIVEKYHKKLQQQEIEIKNLSIENCEKLIKEIAFHKDFLFHIIETIAKTHIDDYHFLDYKVSDFWKCENSPIGMCVFKLDKGRFHIGCRCRYCENPVERK